MSEEMKAEAIELTITACEKFAQNYEVNYRIILNTSHESVYNSLFLPASGEISQGIDG